jgi:hypothetical protein
VTFDNDDIDNADEVIDEAADDNDDRRRGIAPRMHRI